MAHGETPTAAATSAGRGGSPVIEIRRTLCPTDSSDFSQRALDQAVALAQRFGAALHVVHVIPARLVPVAPVPAPEPVPLQPPTRDVSEALETAGVDEPPAIDRTVPSPSRS